MRTCISILPLTNSKFIIRLLTIVRKEEIVFLYYLSSLYGFYIRIGSQFVKASVHVHVSTGQVLFFPRELSTVVGFSFGHTIPPTNT